MPQLRVGCRGESFFSLQMSVYSAGAASPWNDALAMTADASVLIRDLNPHSVYQFRVAPHNSKGAGPPSQTSGFVMVDKFTQVLAAPTVVAVSTASFSLKWDGISGPCRPSIHWRVSYTTDTAANTAAAQWHDLTSNASGSAFLAYPLRCPQPGCAFRVQPGAPGTGWLQPSMASTLVASLQLPPLSGPDNIRVELRLRTEQLDRDTLQMQREVASDVANVLHVPQDTVQVQDVYGAGRYIIIELSGAVQAGINAPTSAGMLAQQLSLLAHQLAEGQSGGLRSGLVTRDLDGTLGVQLLTVDGQQTPLLISEQARAMLEQLPRYYGTADEDLLLTQSRTITVAITLLAVIVACSRGMCRSHSANSEPADDDQEQIGILEESCTNGPSRGTRRDYKAARSDGSAKSYR